MVEPELKAAYERLAQDVEDVGRLEGAEGVIVEWVVVYATQRYDGDGGGVTQVGTLLPDGGGHVPYHRMMGLLDFALTRCRAEVADDGDGS